MHTLRRSKMFKIGNSIEKKHLLTPICVYFQNAVNVLNIC